MQSTPSLSSLLGPLWPEVVAPDKVVSMDQMATTQEYCEKYWMRPGGSTPQNSSCTAICHSLWKLSKLDEPDLRDTAGEVGTNT